MSPEGVIGIIVGAVLSIGISYIFYILQIKDKKPYYIVHTNPLIMDYQSSLPGIEITFKGEKIKNLYITNIGFWNRGKETIHRTDITSLDPLRITASNNTKILGFSVIEQSSLSNHILLSTIDEKNIQIDFEYLDKNDNCLFQVIHTGGGLDNLIINGKIKGVNFINSLEVSNVTGEIASKQMLKIRRFRLIYVMIVNFIFMCIPIILIPWYVYNSLANGIEQNPMVYPFLLFCAFAGFMLFQLSLGDFRKMSKEFSFFRLRNKP